MPRGYYKEPDVKYGRPKTKIAREPPRFFRTYDDEMRNWDARRFFRELVIRQGTHDWEQERGEWKRSKKSAFDPLGETYLRGTPVTDPDEINKFLCRPPAVSQITSKEDAIHALRLGLILIAVDPHAPNLADKLNIEAKKIRAKYPLPIKPRGRPSDSIDVVGIDANKVEQWRIHRIVALHELRLKGYDPRKERKQLAAWMFPEIRDKRKRGLKLDRAVELLDEALAATREIDAQTR
jgi:hypothetical protein